MQFHILVYDQRSKAPCKDALGLLDMFRGCATGWGLPRPTMDEASSCLQGNNWTLEVKQVSAPSVTSSSQGQSFLVKAEGDFAAVEPLRAPIAQYLNKVNFRPIYILRDDISEEIAIRIYPHIYKLENRLREFLTRFYCTIYGPDFWPVVAAKLMPKAEQFEGNEKVFTPLTDTTSYRLTFDDLGGIVFKLGARQPDLDNLIKNVRDLVPDDANTLTSLQKDLEPNYDRFFQPLKKGSFQQKWEKFAFFRNKVAHNNLFIASDETEAKRLFDDLMKLIGENETQIATIQVQIPETEITALQDELLDSTPDSTPPPWSGSGSRFSPISKEEFCDELVGRERIYAEKSHGFVGLKRFVEFHLGSLGFDYSSAWKMYEQLIAEGIIERYEVPNAFTGYQTSAVRTKPPVVDHSPAS